ncbi:hypothetical protein OJ253_2567 [Cryptosporidium canis]|uniref:Uncharacterized protein n=1 Tax=Cryptosporidium canis TaxID=195482 RepID=A0A9D5HWW6_9CRYT|nr:hypothetical protein OJ253_2567 [Cryptosporidium canis]
MELKFIDIGSNLTDLMFQGIYNGKRHHEPDLEVVINRAVKGGLDKILITAGSYQETVDALEICEKLDPECKLLFTTIGVHPTRTKEFLCGDCAPKTDEDLRMDCQSCQTNSANYIGRMKDLLRANRHRIKAIGELGLDSDRLGFASMQIQERHFEMQFELLDVCKLPMFLHIRGDQDCYSRFIGIINKKKHLWSEGGGVAHSFTGDLDQLRMILEAGLEIGVNGCSLKTKENLDVAKCIPIDKLHIETVTDSPWCDIKPTHSSYSLVETHFPQVNKPTKWEKGQLVKGRNEPVKIIQVAEVLYKLHSHPHSLDSSETSDTNLDLAEFANKVYHNTLNMYFKTT